MKKLIAICILLLTTGCALLQPPPELTWDHDSETRIIQVTTGGGLQPEAAYYNELPTAQVWGNGRIVWQTLGEDSRRQVWQGQLSEAEMTALLQTFGDKGFFRMDDHYEPKEQVFDSSSTRINVNLLSTSKSVSEYHSGAPRKFHELVGFLSSGAGSDGTPYTPQSGYLIANLINPWDGLDRTKLPVWDSAALGLDLDDAVGIWIEGDVLLRAWDVVNRSYWSPLVVQGGSVFELYLQLPELTGREPQ